MSAKEFAQKMKGAIQEIKANGTDAIYCDNLIAYLDEVINSPEITEAELQVWIEQNKGTQLSNLEMFRSVITSGQNAIKSAFLLNGGAAIAVLAFIGKLTESQASKIPAFAESLTIFVLGVLVVAMTSGFTYLSQWFYAGGASWKEKTGFWLNIVAIIAGLSSYGIFTWGMCSTYNGFINFV